MDLTIAAAAGVVGNSPPPVAAPPVRAAPSPAADVAAQTQRAASDAAVQQQLDAYLRAHDQSLKIQVDSQTGMTIVHIYNDATGELVRQIPTEEVVRIAQYFDEQHPLINVKA